nr:unnamed protein product [Callosobruchus chinensis]
MELHLLVIERAIHVFCQTPLHILLALHSN